MKRILILLSAIFIASCSSDSGNSSGGGGNANSDFNRSAMLTHWANDIIIPAYADLNNSNTDLDSKIQDFTNNPSESTLDDARKAFKIAYISWEKANMWAGVGPGLNENIRDFFNIYPTSAQGIEQLVDATDYKLQLISNSSKQGYPALDYLLNGIGANDNEIIAKYTTDTKAEKYKKFIGALSNKLKQKTKKVYDDWNGSYKDIFIKNNGSSASSSVDLVANDFLLYYEKYYRNGKVRIPSGYSTGSGEPETVEAYYSPDLSIELFNVSTKAMHDFFQGKSYGTDTKGLGFEAYLNALGSENISNDINNKFNAILETSNSLNGTMKDAVVNNRTSVLNLHDKIQVNVVSLKVDMLQKLNITVAYFDGDGD